MAPLKIHVVADDPLARAAIVMSLVESPDCTITGQSDSERLAAEYPDDLSRLPADVILWDLGWEATDPNPDWLDPRMPVVALLADERHAAEVWNGGVRVLLQRNSEAETLLEGARAARRGLIVLDPSLAGPLLPPANPADGVSVEELTPREWQVLQLLAEGLTNKGIALRLDISDHTVKFHVNGILSKLGAQSRTEAVVRATRLGLVSL